MLKKDLEKLVKTLKWDKTRLEDSIGILEGKLQSSIDNGNLLYSRVQEFAAKEQMEEYEEIATFAKKNSIQKITKGDIIIEFSDRAFIPSINAKDLKKFADMTPEEIVVAEKKEHDEILYYSS